MSAIVRHQTVGWTIISGMNVCPSPKRLKKLMVPGHVYCMPITTHHVLKIKQHCRRLIKLAPNFKNFLAMKVIEANRQTHLSSKKLKFPGTVMRWLKVRTNSKRKLKGWEEWEWKPIFTEPGWERFIKAGGGCC